MGFKKKLALGLAIATPFGAGAGESVYLGLAAEHQQDKQSHAVRANHAAKVAVSAEFQGGGISKADAIVSAVGLGLMAEGIGAITAIEMLKQSRLALAPNPDNINADSKLV